MISSFKGRDLKTLLTTCLLVGTLLWSSSAFAQNDPELMKKHVDEALTAFNAGEFAKAAESFRRAFEAYPDINLKKNEMVAWFKAGHCNDAIEAGKRFDASKNSDERDKRDFKNVKVRCDIKKANAQIDLGNLEGAEAALVDAESKHGEVEVEDTQKIADARERIDALKKKDDVPEPDTKIVYKKPAWVLITGISLAVVGAGAIASTPIYTSIANKRLETVDDDMNNDAGYIAIATRYECEYKSGPPRFVGCDEDAIKADGAYQGLLDDREQNRTIQEAILWSGVGVFAVGAGIIIYHFVYDGVPTEVKTSTDIEASFTPTIGPNYAGGSFTLSF